MANCLVTGAKGFIGTHLVKRLKAEGHRVFEFDLKNNWDIRSDNSLHIALYGQKIQYVFHLAALKSVPFSFLQPFAVMETNGIGTLRVLLACRRYGVKRVIYSSSSSVYGGVSGTQASKEDDMPQPKSPYAISKHVGEQYCKMFSSLYGLQTVSLRYFNVFGPGQEPDSPYAAVIPKFIKCAQEGKPYTINGDGSHRRDFTYVSNVVDANILAMKMPGKMFAFTGHVFNIANGTTRSLNDLCDTVDTFMGFKKKKKVKMKRVYGPEREGDIKFSSANIWRAEKYLGYQPKVSFEVGIHRMIKGGK